VFCESGLILLKTSLLPVFQYSLLTKEELLFLEALIHEAPIEGQQETMESSGQYTLTLYPVFNSAFVFYDKRKILWNFVYVMFRFNDDYQDKVVCKTLCNIILQRLMARTSISSDVVSGVVEHIMHFAGEDSCASLPSSPVLLTTMSAQNDMNTFYRANDDDPTNSKAKLQSKNKPKKTL